MTVQPVPLAGTHAIRTRLPAGSKKALFQQMATLAEPLFGQPADAVLHCLLAREKQGATGFGNGTAIPHGKLEGLTQVEGALFRLAAPVDYGAVDGQPVDLVFLLLSPPDAGVAHLKALAAVSRLLRDRDTAGKLRGARSRDAMLALLTADEALDAA